MRKAVARLGVRAVLLWVLALALAPSTGAALPGRPVTVSIPPASLANALAPDGTLRPEATGAFDARHFALRLAPDGRPTFQPQGTLGAGDDKWAAGFDPVGATDDGGFAGNTLVNAVVQTASAVYIAGRFARIGGIPATNVAKWDGTAWQALGAPHSGVTGEVRALALAPNGDLYAGGEGANRPSGVPVCLLARWSGSAWTNLNVGTNISISALAVDGSGVLYAGGSFSQAGGVPANNVARWDGSTWGSLGAGIAGSVSTLATGPGGVLYAAGNFTQAGGQPATRLARWDGSTWSSLGTGPNNQVYTLAVAPNGDLYAGGYFTQIGGQALNYLARWNGTAWSSPAPAPNGTVTTLTLASNGDLYIGGYFTQVGTVATGPVAKWSGGAWSALDNNGTVGGNGTAVTVLALAVRGGELYVGGLFSQAAGQGVNHITRWNGTAWNTLGGGLGLHGTVSAVVVSGTDVYVGGQFTLAGSVPANNVARWDGTAWHALGTGAANGVNGLVRALTVDSNGKLYAGGDFTTAGGASAVHVASWNGTAWSPLGAGTSNGAGGGGTSATTVYALVASGTNVYVGGSFVQAGSIVARYLARWDGSNWNAIGSGTGSGNGTGGDVYALALAPNGELYVGGYFYTVGSVSANFVARLSGSNWSTLGTGSNNGVIGPVYSLVVNGLSVYVGGAFNKAGGLPASCVARWDGSTWSALSGGFATSINALAVSGGVLYAGGDFTQAGGQPTSRIAKWSNGQWSALGTGLNSTVRALAAGAGGGCYAGGDFRGVGDGSKNSVGFGIYDPSTVTAIINSTPKSAMQIYPNPTHGPATLQLSLASVPRAGQVLDALGRVVRAFTVPAHVAAVPLEAAGLPAGCYTVRVQAGGSTATYRLVVE